MEQQARPKKEMTPEQLEILKARLMKAREAKLTRDNKRYVAVTRYRVSWTNFGY